MKSNRSIASLSKSRYPHGMRDAGRRKSAGDTTRGMTWRHFGTDSAARAAVAEQLAAFEEEEEEALNAETHIMVGGLAFFLHAVTLTSTCCTALLP
jgi:hypothetical protein